MRKVILKMHVSLDGYVRAANGDVMGWIFRTYDDQLQAWEVETLWQAGAHIMGRSLYQEMAAYWPNSTEVYAEPMNTIPKVVFSKTLQHADWKDTRIVSGNVAEEITRMKREPGKDILAHGGAGLPLFTEPMNLKLEESTAFPSGSVLLVYTPA